MQMWQQFEDGKIDFVTGLVVTDARLALLRQTETKLRNLVPQLDNKDSYKSIVSVLHSVPTIASSIEDIRAML